MPYKDKEKQKEYQQNHYQRNRDSVAIRTQQRRIEAKESAMKSLQTKTIVDMRLFNLWFNDKDKIETYELSSMDAFELMIKDCFYCGDFAITLDRLDSSLSHTIENCVGCCEFCNSSKGSADPLTFILRSVYRRTFIYYEDDDIWHNNKNHPRLDGYKKHADTQNRSFEITKEYFKKMVVSQCHYCRRHPPANKFFGIDKIYPDDGYTLDNCVTACASCNRDKWKYTLDEFTLRDERITTRYLAGYFKDLPQVPKNICHQFQKT